MGRSTEQRLLDAIIAGRTSVQPRLVYADWLVEQGDLRGELIHVQCRLDEMNRYAPERRALQRREAELLKKHGSRWRKDAKKIVSGAGFRRGMIESVSVSIDAFLDRPDACLNVGPVRAVKLHGNRARIADLAQCPALGKVEALSLSSMKLQGAHWQVFLASPYLANLVELDLSQYSESNFDDAAARSLGRAGCRLRTLDVAGTSLGVEGLSALLDAGVLDDLEEYSQQWAFDESGTERMHRLAQQSLPALQRLDAFRNGIEDEGLRAILDAPWCKQLASLDLFDNGLTDVSGRGLLAADLPRLTELQWGGNPFGDDTVRRLERWAEQRDLERVSQSEWAASHWMV